MPQRKPGLWKIILCLMVLLSLFLCLTERTGWQSTLPQSSLRTLDHWYYYQDGQRIDVTLPGTIRLKDQGDLMLFCSDLKSEDAGMTLSTRGAVYRMQILLGDTVLYAYDDAAFPRNTQMRAKINCIATLPSSSEGQPLTLVFQNEGNGVFSLSSVYVGSSGSIFRQQCADEAFTFLMVFAMVLLGGIAAGGSVYLSAIHLGDRRFASIAAFLFLCAAWCALDSSIVQLLSGFSPIVCYLSFYAFMTLPIPLLCFVQGIGGMRRYRSLDVLLLLFCVNAAAQGVLEYLGFFAFIDMLFVTHLLMAATILTVGALLLVEYRKTGSREILFVLLSFGLLAIFGLAAILLYWGTGTRHYGSIFECGLLIFMLCLLTSLMTAMASSLRFRTEALVYKRLSQEDQLTGLRNRRGFDTLLDELEQTAETYRDIALIFMDLSRLKYVNDTFGHSAGDELIIGAARCMEKVFQDQGTCFRIGGDEFAVIICSPTETEAIWRARLQAVLRDYNATHRFPLSISFGVSFLRDEAGLLKRFSDWKYEADQAMYRDKQLQHASDNTVSAPPLP